MCRHGANPAGQDGRDRTVLRQVPGCCSHSGCIRCKHDAAKGTKNRSDEGRCLYRPVTRLTHSAWLVNRSLPVSTGTSPQHVVQKILKHDTPEMTALYARLSDKTVREHWEKARKVSATGQPVQLSPDGPLGDSAWPKHQLSRATRPSRTGTASCR